MKTDSGLPDDLVKWIAETAGGPVTELRRIAAGARRQGFFVDVDRDGGTLALYLAYDPVGLGDGLDEPALRREAAVYRALGPTPVPVPTFYGLHPTHHAILMARVSGDTWFSRIESGDEQLAVARDFIRHLAALHRLDPRDLDLPGFPKADTLPVHVAQQLDQWEHAYREVQVRDPLVELPLRWLRDNIPETRGPVVLVQGDTGPGNFLYDNGRVTAVLDWELAHLGDPMDDLGWLSLRAVQETFTCFADRLREYEALSGFALDLQRIRYYRVLAELKVVILGQRAQGIVSADSEAATAMIYRRLHQRLCVEALADAMDVTLPTHRLPDIPDTPNSWLFDLALVQLRDAVVPHIDDALAARRAKSVARVVKHLREIDRSAGLAATLELDHMGCVLGARPEDLASGREKLCDAIAERAIDDCAVLDVLARRVAYETALMGGAMGVLAERHLDPLPEETSR